MIASMINAISTHSNTIHQVLEDESSAAVFVTVVLDEPTSSLMSVWQVVPLNPVPAQLQVYEPTLFVQAPPFRHGLEPLHSSMSVWQVVPVNPVPAQLQVYEPTLFVQAPPFRHGLEPLHSSMSV